MSIIRKPSNDPTVPQIIAENPGCHVWINGLETIIYTGEDVPVEVAGD